MHSLTHRFTAIALLSALMGIDSVGAAVGNGREAAVISETFVWSSLAPLPEPRQETGVATLEGRVYVIGGFDSELQVTSRVEYYDPAADAWFDAAPLPQPLHHVVAVAAGGRIFALGGLRGFQFIAVDSVYAYEPREDRWESRAPLPLPRGAGAGAAIGGRIYFAGGLRFLRSIADFAVYDPRANAWTALDPMPTARDHLAAGAIDGVFYAAGGRDGNGLFAALESFDPETGSWHTNLAPMATARGGLAGTAFGARLMTFGGEGNPTSPLGVFAEAEIYAPGSNRWEILPDMPVPRHGTAASILGRCIVVPAGATRQNYEPSSANEVLFVERNPRCTGDGDGSLDVSLFELEQSLRLMFVREVPGTCARIDFDPDASGRVVAAELLAAVRQRGEGCASATLS